MSKPDLDQSHAAMVAALVKPGEEIIEQTTPLHAHLNHMAMLLAGEAGEVVDAIKKHTIYGKELDYVNVIEELGDIEFALEAIRESLGIHRDETLAMNMEKLAKRYPQGKFSNTDAVVRADKDAVETGTGCIEVNVTEDQSVEVSHRDPALIHIGVDPADAADETVKALVITIDEDSGYIKHARRELPRLKPDADEMDKLMADQLLELLTVFGSHGHSGFSAPWAIAMFTKLANHEPLGPLTGEDDEWSDVSGDSDITYQNIRASHVFKGSDGKAYDINGKVFRDPDGATWTNRDSRVDVEFPYTPSTEYVDVDSEGKVIESFDRGGERNQNNEGDLVDNS